LANGKRTSYIYAIFGISLVLFVLGIASILIIEAKRVSTDFKENLTVEVVLKDSVDLQPTDSIYLAIKNKGYVKSARYISKEEAGKILQTDLGEDFMDILGYNPLYASFQLNLFEKYANQDSFKVIAAELSKVPEVRQVSFQKNIVETLDKKVKSATLVIFVIGGLLLFFAISLIFSTTRLAIFSNRFVIKTQQLFGATKWFIMKPFLGRSIFNGFISGFIACIMLAGLIWYMDYLIPELDLQADLFSFAGLFGIIVVFGILISFLSTLTAVFRYLQLNLEDLY
jgi:cell division transport system permease protein